MIAFGPVPSRRLGRSLGINNIPHKHCSYSCVYCQVGLTDTLRIKRQAYYHPEEIYTAAKEKVEHVLESGKNIDYLSFVPEGEPTLDVNLGKAIDLLKSMEIKVAVFTNASLIGEKAVRNDLLKADWVSLKVDAVDQTIWHKINRSHKNLKLNIIQSGMEEFAGEFPHTLVTETMLIKGLNDSKESMTQTSEFLQKLNLTAAYLAVPTRPPAEKWVKPAEKNLINLAKKIFSDKLKKVECLTEFEGTEYAHTDKAEDDLLSILAVQPMRLDAVAEFLDNANVHWSVVHKLIADGKVTELEYEGVKYFIRRIPGRGISDKGKK